jgi:hypothetical protein
MIRWFVVGVSVPTMNGTEPLASYQRKRSAQKIGRIVLYGFLVFCVLFVGAALFIPKFDTSRQHVDQLVAVAKLRQINALQAKYSADHPGKGFSCTLQLLWSADPNASNDYDPLQFLLSGTTFGYRFSLSSCNTDAMGTIVHYQATALPTPRGVIGYRAFCTDDSGRLWYDPAGSVKNCLAFRRPLP